MFLLWRVTRVLDKRQFQSVQDKPGSYTWPHGDVGRTGPFSSLIDVRQVHRQTDITDHKPTHESCKHNQQPTTLNSIYIGRSAMQNSLKHSTVCTIKESCGNLYKKSRDIDLL